MVKVARQTRPRAVPTVVNLKGYRDCCRAQAERFVRDAFATAYGARIEQFMPELMSLRDDSRRLLAVLGLRAASAEPLFLEHYLERPVEQLLSQAAGQPVRRAGLVEVGNFAVGVAGGGRWLITALTVLLHAQGHEWAVFTCGPELRNAFRRLGIPLIELAPADPTRLPEGESARWGRYYERGPRVMVANVGESHAVLSGLFGHECAMNALWLHALSLGTQST